MKVGGSLHEIELILSTSTGYTGVTDSVVKLGLAIRRKPEEKPQHQRT